MSINTKREIEFSLIQFWLLMTFRGVATLPVGQNVQFISIYAKMYHKFFKWILNKQINTFLIEFLIKMIY